MATLTISAAGLELTRSFEGCRLGTYLDVRGVLTIGYGHTGPEVRPHMVITQQQANQLLLADMHAAIAVVNRLVRVPLKQCEFDALVDFTYNAGVGAFATSTLLSDLNAGNLDVAAEQFAEWVHAGGVVVDGLVRRRAAEAKMFRGEA